MWCEWVVLPIGQALGKFQELLLRLRLQGVSPLLAQFLVL